MECCGYLINDHHLGEEICENCGKSISTIYSDNTFVEEEDDFIEYLDNVCANNHISKIISDEQRRFSIKIIMTKVKNILRIAYIKQVLYMMQGELCKRFLECLGFLVHQLQKKKKYLGKEYIQQILYLEYVSL